MADGGVGEAAVVEAAKTAGEAGAVEAAGAAGAESLGAEALGAEALGGAEGFGAAGAGAFGAEELGTAALGADAFGGAGVAGAEAIPAAGEGLADVGGAGAFDAGGSAGFGGTTPVIEGAPVGGVDPSIGGFESSTANFTPPGTPLKAADAPAGGLKDALGGTMGQNLLDQLMNNKGTAAVLGLNAARALQGRNSSTSKQLGDVAKPFQQTGEDLLAQYRSGKLNPGDEFNINQWEQQQIAAAKSQAAKGGQGNSTASRNAIAKVQQQAQAMREQSRKGILDEGLKALGLATGPLTAAITAEAQQDQRFAQSQRSALNSLMRLQAMQAKNPAPA